MNCIYPLRKMELFLALKCKIVHMSKIYDYFICITE